MSVMLQAGPEMRMVVSTFVADLRTEGALNVLEGRSWSGLFQVPHSMKNASPLHEPV